MSTEQLERAARLAARWDAQILSTAAIDPSDVSRAMGALFTEAGFVAPEQVLFYPSPAAAWAAADAWLPRVRRVLVFPWAWALPLADPRRLRREQRTVDLAVRRRWDRRGARRLEPPKPGTRGALMSREALESLWRCVVEQVESDPYPGLMSSMSDDLYDELFEMGIREDATNQLGWCVYGLLGPLRWAARECAMLEIAADVLGCRVRSEYRAALSMIVESCGLVLAFDPVALACDRPRHIRRSADGLAMTFSDGTTVQTPRRDPAVV